MSLSHLLLWLRELSSWRTSSFYGAPRRLCSSIASRRAVLVIALALPALLSLTCAISGGARDRRVLIDPGKMQPPGKQNPGGKQAKSDPTVIPGKPTRIDPLDPKKKPSDHVEPSAVEELSVPLSRYVNAPGGLNLRAAADVRSAVVRVLKHAEPLRVTARHLAETSLGARAGRWVRVLADGDVGWVFDAYLVAVAPDTSKPTVAEAFRRAKIRSRLVSSDDGGQRVLGGLTKASGHDNFRVATLKRLCGSGIADKKPVSVEGGVEFFVSYRWCSVDPSDIVRTRCIQCKLVRYRCLIEPADLESHRSGSIYGRPVRCAVANRAFCERDCGGPIPLRGPPTP